MRTHSRYQYIQNALNRSLVALAVLAGTATPLYIVPTASAVDLVSNDTVYDWERRFRIHLQQIWRILENCPPPKLEDPVVTWAQTLNSGYALYGIDTNLTPEEQDYYTLAVFDTIDHLETDPGSLDPALRDATMNTLVSMLHDLQALGSQQ